MTKKELRQQVACEWLEQNYLQFGYLRHDIVTDRLQIRVADLHSLRAPHNATSVIGDPAEFRGKENWRNLTDKDINTMVCQCVNESGVNISITEMWTALKSDMVPTVHPIREWLESLPPYTPDQPDWIDWLASQVRVKNNDNIDNFRGNQYLCRDEDDLNQQLKQLTPDQPDWIDCLASQVRVKNNDNIDNLRGNQLPAAPMENNTTPSYTTLHDTTPSADRLWRACFKKWFVAMVASWMKDEVVNHTVLVLVGRQGIFKTTWLDHLIPPELRAYSSKLPLSGQISKDDRLRLCENAMLNIDELDAICGREMNIVKSLLTSTDVNERAAYGRLKERKMRLASFCASTNNREFLTDVTGNRRWLPFEVENIQNPFHITLPYERIYAQAKALVEEGKFIYWFDLEDIEQLEQHNEEFRAQDSEEQLLPILFDVPAEGKGEFMTTAEISDKLVTYGGIKKPMNTRQLGILLKKKGFIGKRLSLSGSTVRGWMVYQRQIDEIKLAKQTMTLGRPDNIF